MNRRTLLRATAAGAFAGSLWQAAALMSPVNAAPAQPAVGPYGPLLHPNAHGIQLPPGFTSRVVARSRSAVAGYHWHDAPDGGACFPHGSGWVYVSNSELDTGGGASALRFDSSGTVTSAYRILGNTRRNCAGGATPWGRWLSCEEVDRGFVYETSPLGGTAVQRPAMGRFRHEAAASDPVRRVIYLTEDEPDGCFYRFRPDTWGDLSAGTLEVLVAGTATAGSARWHRVPEPDGWPTRTRDQVAGAKRFNGGEGCFYANDRCWFTTKGDNRVWQFNAESDTYHLAYDDSLVNPGPATLIGTDNVTGAASGDLYISEDGGNMEINLITPGDTVSVFLRIHGQNESEITGPAFNPAGDRLYFSSQRGTSGESSGGITYEVTGPFRS